MKRVAAAGGPVTDLPQPSRNTLNFRFFPTFLPDGRHYLFLGIGLKRTGGGIDVGSIDSPDSRNLVPATRASATYAGAGGAGFLIFRRETTLLAQPFDAERLELTGTPQAFAESPGFNAITYQGMFSASRTGAVAYASTSAASQLTWMDRAGRRLGIVGAPADHNSICFSHDGKRLIYDVADAATGSVDIWQMELPSGTPSRLTHEVAVDFFPVCSPAGDEIVFSSLRIGPPDLYRMSLSTPGRREAPARSAARDDPQRLVPRRALSDLPSVEPQDAARHLGPATRRRRAARGHRHAGGRAQRTLLARRPLARVLVERDQPLPGVRHPVSTHGAKWQISPSGGHQPQWSRDGRELFYVTPDQHIVSVSINASRGTFVPERQTVIAKTR
jgi:hypothetical protein